jgi:hypothetical protein
LSLGETTWGRGDFSDAANHARSRRLKDKPARSVEAVVRRIGATPFGSAKDNITTRSSACAASTTTMRNG